MGTVKISTTGLIFGFLLLIIPILISYYLKLRIIKTMILSVTRMSIQLFVVGIFLEYIFKLNNILLNIGWLLLMIATGISSAIMRSKLKWKAIIAPLIISFTLPTLATLIYFNFFIVHLNYLFDARYLIALGGMLLGNVLGSNIIAINSFYQKLKTENKLYLYRLSLGATIQEALAPFVRSSFRLSLLPTLAKTATMGIVSLPGMMTGQMLGGSSPTTAIKYQIAIMIAIFTTSTLSILLTILLSIKFCFSKYGILKEEAFKKHH